MGEDTIFILMLVEGGLFSVGEGVGEGEGVDEDERESVDEDVREGVGEGVREGVGEGVSGDNRVGGGVGWRLDIASL